MGLLIGYFLIILLLVYTIPPALFAYIFRTFSKKLGFSFMEYYKTGLFIMLSQLAVLLPAVLVASLLVGLGWKNEFWFQFVGIILPIAVGWFVVKKRLNQSFKDTCFIFLSFIGITFLSIFPIRIGMSFFICPYSMPSGSMEDTLMPGDFLISNQFFYGHSFFNKTPRFFQIHKPKKGDIVIFLYPPDQSKIYMKRCLGTPGDVLEMKNKFLYINGQKQTEPYVKHVDPLIIPRGDSLNTQRDNFGPVTVGPGNYYMLRDNRDNSLDSRYFGTLDERLIKGKAYTTYWSRKNHWFLFKKL